jgi:hypothetical protein
VFVPADLKNLYYINRFIPRNGLIDEYLFVGNANYSSGNGNNSTILTFDRFKEFHQASSSFIDINTLWSKNISISLCII